MKLLSLYLDSATKASKGLLRNWLLIVASVASYMIYQFAATMFQTSGFAGGLLVGLIQIYLLTLYYGWLTHARQNQAIKLQDLYYLDYPLFSGIINIGFIFFMGLFLAGLLAQASAQPAIILIPQLVILLVFNAIPESIYIHRYDSFTALRHAYNFTRDNWIEWYIPFVLLLLPWTLKNPSGVLVVLSQTDNLLPALPIIPATAVFLEKLNAPNLLNLTLGVILANWFMLFRGYLFDALDGRRRSQGFW